MVCYITIYQTMDVKEEWKQIQDYDNYEVSSLGNVRNSKTGRVLKLTNKGGYVFTGLSKNSNGKTIPVHRLVALAFLDNPENKPQVNHKDKTRSNNIISNLEWSTASENNIHRSTNVIQTTNQQVKVWRVDINTDEKLELYDSIYLASQWIVSNNNDKLCVDTVKGGISCASRGIYKSSFGYKWSIYEYTDLDDEIWKPVTINGQTYDNYFVSNLGRFKNSKKIIMSDYKPHHSGYIFVRVDKNKYALHRIIASTFIENLEPEINNVVNHIDGNKLNNSAVNLEWTTIKGNNIHNHKCGFIKYYTRTIVQYDLAMNKIKEFGSIVEAAKELGIKSIKEVLYNHQKTAGGFIFKYLD
jgi:hypothetical protein